MRSRLVWSLACWPPNKTARVATEIGGLVASRVGPMPELREELAKLVSHA